MNTTMTGNIIRPIWSTAAATLWEPRHHIKTFLTPQKVQGVTSATTSKRWARGSVESLRSHKSCFVCFVVCSLRATRGSACFDVGKEVVRGCLTCVKLRRVCVKSFKSVRRRICSFEGERTPSLRHIISLLRASGKYFSGSLECLRNCSKNRVHPHFPFNSWAPHLGCNSRPRTCFTLL